MKRILKLAALTLPALAIAGFASAARADYCREFTQVVTIGGERQSAHGTACLEPDGSWRVQRVDTVAPSPAPRVEYVNVETVRYVPYPVTRVVRTPSLSWHFGFYDSPRRRHHAKAHRHHGYRPPYRHSRHHRHEGGGLAVRW